MIERVERWVEEARWETGVTGFPRLHHLERLVERCAPWLEVERGPITGCLHLPEQGRVRIVVADSLDPWSYEHALCEELGHALFTCGLAAAVRRQRPVLAQANEGRDERIARTFRDAWFLPASLVLTYWHHPMTLARESGTPWQCVQQRMRVLQHLADPEVALPAWLDPPAWAENLVGI